MSVLSALCTRHVGAIRPLLHECASNAMMSAPAFVCMNELRFGTAMTDVFRSLCFVIVRCISILVAQ
jgi:hypothetical protein